MDYRAGGAGLARSRSGRVAKVLVNARGVAPNRRATRRSLALSGVVVDMKIKLDSRHWKNCYFVLTRSLQQKSLSPRRARDGYKSIAESSTGYRPRLMLNSHVSRDMKLQSILLGWTGFLTKSCVSPQVFHGSTRLTGCGRVATTVRGVEPSRKCIKPGSLKPGES